MNETLAYRDESVTAEQKQAALEAVLRSNTFARADQLKSFLKYVCEMEIAGHGHELSEYMIGVEALGRPSQYSPGDDSAVRNRAFALRKKLQEFYEREKPDAPIRIELHKGSYCPHFVEGAALEKSDGWGPILGPHAEVLICVANPPSFSAHSASEASAPSSPSFNGRGARPMPRELLEWYKQRYPAPDDQSHFLTITTNATYWGDSIGAMTALKTLTSAGIIPQIFPEKVVTVPTLRRRNVILFGAPEYSPAVAHFLEKCPLTVKYLDSIITRGDGQTPTALYSGRRDAQNRMTHVYGLITVLPNESSVEHPRRTVIFSGVNSAGAQAAAEFFSSTENLIELRKHLNKEGHENFPPAYQVVVSAETDDNILLNFKYETHRLAPN